MLQDVLRENIVDWSFRPKFAPLEDIMVEVILMKVACKHVEWLFFIFAKQALHYIVGVQPSIEDKHAFVCDQSKSAMKYIGNFYHGTFSSRYWEV